MNLPEHSLLDSDIKKGIKLSVWVTMYNEPFSQLLESVAGIYRAYYELVEIREDFRNKVNIVIVWDGIEHLSKLLLYHA